MPLPIGVKSPLLVPLQNLMSCYAEGIFSIYNEDAMSEPRIRGVWQHLAKRRVTPATAYDTPRKIWEKACEYFKWCEDNPLKEIRLVNRRNGRPYREVVNHPRAFTIEGLSTFMGIRARTWRSWRDDEKKGAIVERIENAIRAQKFEYAAVDMMNASLIAKDLRLDAEDKGRENEQNEDALRDAAERFTRAIAGLAARGSEAKPDRRAKS